MDENKSSSQLPLPGIAVVLLVIGVLIYADDPFKPTRPEAPTDITSTAEDVRARLWQDPFEAVEVHRENKHSNAEWQLERVMSDFYENSMYQGQQHRICVVNRESTSEKIKTLRKLKTKLADGNNDDMSKREIDRELLKEIISGLIVSSAHTVSELRCQIQRDVQVSKNNALDDLHILAVMVPGGSYPEDRETRIRSRYAVISGLSSAGYIPNDPEHIGYIDFSTLCEKSLEGYYVLPKYCDWPATIPYEWFKLKVSNISESGLNRYADNMLILWLDDEGISQSIPLSMLDRLRDALTPGPIELNGKYEYMNGGGLEKTLRIKYDVIGPASSTTLVKMKLEALYNSCDSGHVDECNEPLVNNYKKYKARIISPRATIEDKALDNIIRDSLPKKDIGFLIERDTNWLPIIRTITTDEKLVKEMLCELLRRGINPYLYKVGGLPKKENSDVNEHNKYCSDYSTSSLNKNNRQDHIILIGEWDTIYSRNFNRLFSELIKNKNPGHEPVWLHSFNYYRGIDGSLGEDKKNTANTDKGNNDKKSLRRPVGANQFDYLRRLGGQLSELSKLIQGKGTIRAIGILGSDTYDKLLILQALRSIFPSAVFFTTDLDARMLHHEENDWARNLVVASGYGLTPDINTFEGLSFRDSYQTSVYEATRFATLKKSYINSVGMHAKIYEIGNKYAIDYSHNNSSSKSDNSSHVENILSRKILLYLALSFLLILLLVLQTSNKTRIIILAAATIAYSIVIFVYILDASESIEYSEMFTGTSIWPALIVRMVAALLAFEFIFFSVLSLRKNTIRILTRNMLANKKHEIFMDRVLNDLKKDTEVRNGLVRKLGIYIKNIIVSIKMMYGVRYYDCDEIKSRRFKQPDTFSYVFISAWGRGFKKNSVIQLDNLFYQYSELGKTRWWFGRVALMSFLYIILTYNFLFSFPNLPYAPISGEISANAHFLVLWAVLIPYVFLIFFVVDVTRLYARFVELLSKCRVDWPSNVVSEYCSEYGLDKDITVEKLKLDLIVQRSKSVDILIFLPFVILTLIIVSRSSYFDRWHTTIPLAVVMLLGACIALSNAIRLRRTAKRAQSVALERLDKKHKMQCYEESKPVILRKGVKADVCKNNMAERIKETINDINTIDVGPFLPLTKHPIVTAIAMPFGGIGGLYLFDYLTSLSL